MNEAKKTPNDVVPKLAQLRSGFKTVGYQTVGELGKNDPEKALTFTQTERAVSEIAKYHGKIGEVWATVNSLLEQEIQLRESTTGDEKEAHSSRVDQLISMLGVLEHDLELSPVYHVDANIDDPDSGMSDMARGGLRQARTDRLMTQHTLEETKTLLETILQEKRAKDTSYMDGHPDYLENHLQSVQATEMLIAYVDRLLGIS